MDQTNAPKINPKTVPSIPTVNAILASFSFFVFAITAKIIAAGPNKIGKNKKEIPPNIIASVENVLLLVWPGVAPEEAWLDIVSPSI
jgi:hypothetical protein